MARSQRLTGHALTERERAFVADPGEWPRWPLLPMKRRNGDFLADDFCGFLFADGRPQIYIAEIFSVWDKQPKPKTWKEALSSLKRIDYPDFDAMLTDWEVD